MISKRYRGPYFFTLEDYELLCQSKEAGQLTKYTIEAEENRIRFRNTGYTLFFLTRNLDDVISLQGLDKYGMRDNKFKKYIEKLPVKIRE
ncbi:MAG: hypothetical protein ACI857_001533 [Arenicella sp.]